MSKRASTITAEGKTKRILEIPGDLSKVLIESKDTISKKDGLVRDELPGKGALSNRTTSNVFELLRKQGFSVAFIERHDATRFLAHRCRMLPFEVVVRGESDGSFFERNPEVPRGIPFREPIIELYLKTQGKIWSGNISSLGSITKYVLPVDDPFLTEEFVSFKAYNPHRPLADQQPPEGPVTIPYRDIFKTHSSDRQLLSEVRMIARNVFICLQGAWKKEGGRLVDLKMEFGVDAAGKLRTADVIDSDSWRVMVNGKHLDKQPYRDGADLATVLAIYTEAAAFTDRFV